jgi:hypothetical protein
MKRQHTVKLALLGLLLIPVAALQAQHEDHDHASHSHEAHVAGPNGGRIIHAVEPHFEFFVREDRTIQITFLNDENQPMAPSSQEISAIAGDRRSPTRLTFSLQEGILLSQVALPEGNNIPIIISIKSSPEDAIIRERFMVNLAECPSCDYLEYACTCEHAGESHESHSH